MVDEYSSYRGFCFRINSAKAKSMLSNGGVGVAVSGRLRRVFIEKSNCLAQDATFSSPYESKVLLEVLPFEAEELLLYSVADKKLLMGLKL